MHDNLNASILDIKFVFKVIIHGSNFIKMNKNDVYDEYLYVDV